MGSRKQEIGAQIIAALKQLEAKLLVGRRLQAFLVRLWKLNF